MKEVKIMTLFVQTLNSIILSGMSYNTICHDEKCRKAHTQLFGARSHDSQIHYDEKHIIQPIYYGSPFFRSLKTEPMKFGVSMEKARSLLQKQYLRSVELIKQTLKANFEQSERKIIGIYELDSKEINFDVVKSNLKRATSKTQLYLNIVNWKKTHPQEDLQNYIQSLPETYIRDYTAAMNSFTESLASNLPASSNNIYQNGDWFKNKESQSDLDESQKMLEQQSKPLEGSSDQKLKFNQKFPLQNQTGKKKRKKKDKEILKQLAEVFCNSYTDLRYCDIQQPLLNKLSTGTMFQSYYDSLMNRVCLNIQQATIKDLRFRRMKKSERARIWTDLKNYRSWMDTEEADIFIRCVGFFMNINKDIEISPYEIYVMYVLITTKVIEKMKMKNLMLHYNVFPKNLKKEIIYLYLHYSSFIKVKEMLTALYPYDKKLTDGYLMETFKEIMSNTYNRLKERESIEDARFQELIHLKTDFGGELWSPVVRKYMEFQIFNQVDSSEKIWLETIMKTIVSKQQDNEQINAPEDEQAIERSMERSSQMLHFPKIIKDEQVSDSEQGELDQESSED